MVHCTPTSSHRAILQCEFQLSRENERILHEKKYNAAEDRLRYSLDAVDWTAFKCSVENLDEFATTVTDFISKCVDDCVPKKSIRNTTGVAMPALTAQVTPAPSVTASEVRSVFLGVNPRKVMGLDGVPGQALRSCADQLVEIFIDIFTLSLLQAEVPTCFKKATIIPVPEKTNAVCLNDYRPVALTSIIMKCFKRLVMVHINSSLPACLDL
eukprot:g46943.t1